MKAVCLVSGGIDSTVLLFRLQKDGYKIIPLHFNYGQKAEKLERQAVEQICKTLHLKPEIIDVSGLRLIPSGLTDPDISPVTQPIFPCRNLLFLTLAAAYATTKAIDVIAVGFLGDSLFPDQTKEFVKKAEIIISDAVGNRISILVPFIELNKLEVIRLAKKYNISLDITYSCYAGTTPPCGNCLSCIDRKNIAKTGEF